MPAMIAPGTGIGADAVMNMKRKQLDVARLRILVGEMQQHGGIESAAISDRDVWQMRRRVRN